MIKINDLCKIFEKTLSLDHVTLDFSKGDAVALMGANGAGKTTLIRSILGYYHPSSGSVLVNGLNPVKATYGSLETCLFCSPASTTDQIEFR